VRRLRAGGADGAADLAEGRVGVAAERGDSGDADHNDEGQHDRVFDGRRAVFTLQEIDREIRELTHVPRPFLVNTRKPKKTTVPVRALRAGGADGAADLAEGRVGVAAERGDGGDADHDNEGQHDRVFDGGRAVFTLQKINRELSEFTHVLSPFHVKLNS